MRYNALQQQGKEKLHRIAYKCRVENDVMLAVWPLKIRFPSPNRLIFAIFVLNRCGNLTKSLRTKRSYSLYVKSHAMILGWGVRGDDSTGKIEFIDV